MVEQKIWLDVFNEQTSIRESEAPITRARARAHSGDGRRALASSSGVKGGTRARAHALSAAANHPQPWREKRRLNLFLNTRALDCARVCARARAKATAAVSELFRF